MVYKPPKEPIPNTFLWPMGFRLEMQGLKCYQTYDDIKDVWLLGDYLAWPFYFLSVWFLELRDIAWEGHKLLGKYYLWIENLVSGVMFQDILDYLSYNYQWIRNDPLDFIRTNLSLISSDVAQFLISAKSWYQGTFYALFPGLTIIISNAIGWVEDKVKALYPSAIQFLTSPTSTFIHMLRNNFPILASFVASPTGYIITLLTGYRGDFRTFLDNPPLYIYNKIREWSASLASFMDNPYGYIRSIVCTLFGFSYDSTKSFSYQVLLVILESIKNLSSSVKEQFIALICSIVLEFI